MNSIVGAFFWAASTLVSLPAAVFSIECLFGVLPRRRPPKRRPRGPTPPRAVVVVPAHDEEAGLGETLENLRSEADETTEIVVVADNCSDSTADVAKSAGACVIERHDPERRGKGYALAFAFEHLSKSPPDVVVIIDADCTVSPGTIGLLVDRAVETGRPIQAEDLVTLPSDPSPLSRVSVFAFMVRNRVRPAGMLRLGLPCQLAGTGMALPWPAVCAAPPTEGYLAEDLLMGIELAKLGFTPLFCPEAHVTSPVPRSSGAGRAQRSRWEQGQLATLLHHGPRLVLRGMQQRRIDLIALGLDVMVPPLALLVGLMGATTVAASAAVLLGATAARKPLAVLGLSSALVTGGVLASWIRFGRRELPPRHLVVVPFYMLWKVPMYLSFLFKRRGRTWERTEREEPDEGKNP